MSQCIERAGVRAVKSFIHMDAYGSGAVPIWYANHQGYWTWTLDQRDQFADIGTNGFDGGKIYEEDNTLAVPLDAPRCSRPRTIRWTGPLVAFWAPMHQRPVTV